MDEVLKARAAAVAEGKEVPPTATHNFWARANAVFKFIDSKGDGDGRVSRDELRMHFDGNTEARVVVVVVVVVVVAVVGGGGCCCC